MSTESSSRPARVQKVGMASLQEVGLRVWNLHLGCHTELLRGHARPESCYYS